MPAPCPRPGQSWRDWQSWAIDSATLNGGPSPNGRTGWRTDSTVTSRRGSTRIGDDRPCGHGGGLGIDGRDGIPGSVDRRRQRARLRDGHPLDRRGRALRGFDRAIALRTRDAGDPGDGLVGPRGSRRRTTSGAAGHRRQGLPARRHDRLLGARLRGHVTRRTRRGEVWIDHALEFGMSSEEIELILPPLWGLAEVALQAGDPDRAFAVCRDAYARSVAVGERVLLTPFVVTGTRAALQAGRPTEAAAWLADCVDAPPVDPRCHRRGPRPRARARRPRRRGDRGRSDRARVGGRRLGPARTGVGGQRRRDSTWRTA